VERGRYRKTGVEKKKKSQREGREQKDYSRLGGKKKTVTVSFPYIELEEGGNKKGLGSVH